MNWINPPVGKLGKLFVAVIVFLFYVGLFLAFTPPQNNLLSFLWPFHYGLKEGFDDPTLPGITSVSIDRRDLPLSQYMIKASYLSAYDGNQMTLDQLKSVLKRGCRFVDFEIFTSPDGDAFLGYSVDPTFHLVRGFGKTMDDRITIQQVFSVLAANSFGVLPPNPQDPMIIQLRVKSNDPYVYTTIARAIQKTLLPKLYMDGGKANPVGKDTYLSEIMGKFVVVLDRSTDMEPSFVPSACSDKKGDAIHPGCLNIQDFVNVYSGGSEWRKVDYSPPNNLNDTTKGGLMSPILDDTTQNKTILYANQAPVELNLVQPAPNTALPAGNPDPVSIISYVAKLGCQTMPMLFYVEDTGLLFYETLFRNFKSAFVPMGYAVNAMNQQGTINTNVGVYV